MKKILHLALLLFSLPAFASSTIPNLTNGGTVRTTDLVPVYRTDGNNYYTVVGSAATQASTAFLQPGNNLGDVSSATTSLTNILPSQSGKNGNVLQSNGTSANWAAVVTSGYPTSTWAGKPSAATAGANTVYFITDIGTAGAFFASDGTNWKPVGGRVALFSSSTAVSHTGDTTETALANPSLPAGIMTAEGQIIVTTTWTVTNGAGTKTPRVRFNSITGVQYFNPAVTTISTLAAQITIMNRHATNAQFGFISSSGLSYSTSGAAIVTGAVDTTTSVPIYITGQLSSGADTITLERYLIELVVP